MPDHTNGEQPAAVVTPETLYDLTFAESRAERDRRAKARNLIGREDCDPELNRMGTMRWYLHPHLDTPSTRALYFHELEIPQGSNSGKLYCQGGMIHFVLIGSGHTVLDGRAHEWEEGDVIAIPIRESGATYQHFNSWGRTGPDAGVLGQPRLGHQPRGRRRRRSAGAVPGVAGPARLNRAATALTGRPRRRRHG